MFPKLGPVPTYAVFYFAAMVAHLLILVLLARRMRLRPLLPWTLGMTFALAMLVGAKALFDIQHGSFRPSLMLSPEHYMKGGMWGGPLAYLALAVPIVLAWARPRRDALDLVAYALPFPMMLAKIGCFCQGCCHGRAFGRFWACRFPAGGSAPAGVPLHPTQIYEILLLAAILLALLLLKRPIWRGLRLPWFVVLYGLGRAFVEIFRGDSANAVFVGPLSPSQLVVLAGAAAAAVAIAVGYVVQRGAASPPAAAAEPPAPEPPVPNM